MLSILPRGLTASSSPEDVEATVAAAGSLAEGPSEVVEFENRYATKDGTWRWLLWSARSDEHRVYAVAKDITERKRLEREREELVAQLEAMARTDQLTGLPNRRSWDEEVRHAISVAHRQKASLALVLIDLDRFKLFNDTHGHPAGDALLTEAAARSRTRARADVLSPASCWEAWCRSSAWGDVDRGVSRDAS